MAQQYDLFFVETWPISSKEPRVRVRVRAGSYCTMLTLKLFTRPMIKGWFPPRAIHPLLKGDTLLINQPGFLNSGFPLLVVLLLISTQDCIRVEAEMLGFCRNLFPPGEGYPISAG